MMTTKIRKEGATVIPLPNKNTAYRVTVKYGLPGGQYESVRTKIIHPLGDFHANLATGQLEFDAEYKEDAATVLISNCTLTFDEVTREERLVGTFNIILQYINSEGRVIKSDKRLIANIKTLVKQTEAAFSNRQQELKLKGSKPSNEITLKVQGEITFEENLQLQAVNYPPLKPEKRF